MVAKSFARKQVWTKHFHTFFGQKFLWLQNHFFGNRFDPKIFIKKFPPKIFMVAKSFPRKWVRNINFHQIFFGRKFICFQNNFLGNRFKTKIFIRNISAEIFLQWHNHFLGNRVEPKIVIKKFPQKVLWQQNNFLGNRFEPKIFKNNFRPKI